jgi:hypothetical protein
MFLNNNNNCCSGSNDMFLILLLLCGFGNSGGHNSCGHNNRSIDMCELIMLLVLMSCFSNRDCCK